MTRRGGTARHAAGSPSGEESRTFTVQSYDDVRSVCPFLGSKRIELMRLACAGMTYSLRGGRRRIRSVSFFAQVSADAVDALRLCIRADAPLANTEVPDADSVVVGPRRDAVPVGAPVHRERLLHVPGERPAVAGEKHLSEPASCSRKRAPQRAERVGGEEKRAGRAQDGAPRAEVPHPAVGVEPHARREGAVLLERDPVHRPPVALRCGLRV